MKVVLFWHSGQIQFEDYPEPPGVLEIIRCKPYNFLEHEHTGERKACVLSYETVLFQRLIRNPAPGGYFLYGEV